MAYGLIQIGDQYRDQSGKLFSGLAQEEATRNQANKQIQEQERASLAQTAGLGAAIGFAGGLAPFAAAGPVGLAVGLGVGLLAGSLF